MFTKESVNKGQFKTKNNNVIITDLHNTYYMDIVFVLLFKFILYSCIRVIEELIYINRFRVVIAA